MHFLTSLEEVKDLPEYTWLIAADVTSLYMVIPNISWIQAAKQALHEFKPNPQVKPSNDSLIQLLEFVLTKNNFKFNRQHYLHLGGTGIGTKAALSYANTFMGKFENDFVYTYPTQPLLWKRYKDKCFFIWTDTEDSLNAFIKYLNNCDPNIKFTFVKSQHSEHI